MDRDLSVSSVLDECSWRSHSQEVPKETVQTEIKVEFGTIAAEAPVDLSLSEALGAALRFDSYYNTQPTFQGRVDPGVGAGVSGTGSAWRGSVKVAGKVREAPGWRDVLK